MWIEAIAPGRIDLAGSLSDVYPIYAFEGHGLTISASIDLSSSARIRPRTDSRIDIFSKDYGVKLRYENISHVAKEGELKTVQNLIAAFSPESGLTVITQSDIPIGSGLAGSSSLLIALCAALNEVTNSGLSFDDMVRVSHFSEIQGTKSISGTQDFYASGYGGINAISFDWKGTRVEPLSVSDEFLRELASRLTLCNSGESRSSGEIDWEVLKRYVEGKAKVPDLMKQIIEIAHEMRDAILEENTESVGMLIAKDWEKRKLLDPRIRGVKTNLLIEEALESSAISAKVCGSGGGSFIAYSKQNDRQRVAKALSNYGGTILDFSFTNSGLAVSRQDVHS